MDLLLPKIKPISVGVVCRPPKDTNFLQLFAEILNSLNVLENEMLVLGDMNMNILQNGGNLFERNAKTSKGKILIQMFKTILNPTSTVGLKQLIKVSTRITCNISTFIDHVI